MNHIFTEKKCLKYSRIFPLISQWKVRVHKWSKDWNYVRKYGNYKLRCIIFLCNCNCFSGLQVPWSHHHDWCILQVSLESMTTHNTHFVKKTCLPYFKSLHFVVSFASDHCPSLVRFISEAAVLNVSQYCYYSTNQLKQTRCKRSCCLYPPPVSVLPYHFWGKLKFPMNLYFPLNIPIPWQERCMNIVSSGNYVSLMCGWNFL